MFATPLRPDLRRLPRQEESLVTCRRCGTRIHVLPDDKRLGYCFDCYDPSEIREPSY